MILLVFDTKEECDKFVVLYEKYYKVVLYTIRRFIEDKFIAEDILQEVYINISKNLDKIDMNDEKRSRNYIITISRNYCCSYLRKQNKVNEDIVESDSIFKNNAEDVLEGLVEKEDFERLILEIHNLKDTYKSVLQLKYINELSDVEIARFLNLKMKTVQMRLYRARIILRNKMEVD